MDDGKRLKRGLKDISPLFGPEAAVPAPARVSAPKTAQPVQSLGVFCPQNAKQTLYLSSKFAFRIKAFGGECVLLSIGGTKSQAPEKPLSLESPTGVHLKRFHLTLDQLEDACRFQSHAVENFGSSVFFFNFDYSNPIQFKKVMPMLDKWIIFLTPELESLTEAFKFIKASLALNHTLEYFVVCEGPKNSSKSSVLYERFSEIVSRRIGVSVNWLGEYDSASPETFAGISLESLQLTPALDSLEKRALAGWVYPETRYKG